MKIFTRMLILHILGIEIINRYERKRRQQITGSIKGRNKTKIGCFSDGITNKIPQVNIANGPRSIFRTWIYEWRIDKVSVISTRRKVKKEYEL